jgi:hypothetical protein
MPENASHFSNLEGEDSDKIGSLHEFMKTITQAVNQHAVMMNNMHEKQKDFVEHRELIGSFDKIEGAISLYDTEFLKKLEIEGTF